MWLWYEMSWWCEPAFWIKCIDLISLVVALSHVMLLREKQCSHFSANFSVYVKTTPTVNTREVLKRDNSFSTDVHTLQMTYVLWYIYIV